MLASQGITASRAFFVNGLRTLTRALAFLAVLLLPAAAQVASTAADGTASTPLAIWYADHTSANRVEVVTDRVSQTIPLAHEATALAVDPNDQSLWVLTHKRLLKFNEQTSLLLELDLKTLVPRSEKNAEDIEDPETLLLNPYDGSLWISAKKTLVHIDSQGRLLLNWRHDEKIEAAALSLDENLWMISNKQLIHLSTQGAVLNTYALKQLARGEERHFQHVAVDSLSGILWLASEETLYQIRIADLLTQPLSRVWTSPDITDTSLRWTIVQSEESCQKRSDVNIPRSSRPRRYV